MSASDRHANERRDVWLLVASIGLLSFWGRLLLSGRNSYWLDELYSVHQYVVMPDSVRSAIGSLAETSIHPPIYQFLLYVWIQTFGDTETAARSLSNLVVSISVVFVFLLARRAYGTTTGIMTSAAYAVSFAAVHFGIEARSYGLTMGVSTASSLAAILYVIQRRDGVQASTRTVRGLTLAFLCAANLGLMLTHYYNFFFIVAQALFIGIATLVTGPRTTRIRRLVAAVATYLLQLALFAAVWGRITVQSYQRNAGSYDAAEISYTPVFIVRSVVRENLAIGSLPTLVLAGIALAGAAYLIASGLRDWRDTGRVDAVMTTSYLIAVLLGSGIVAYVAFTVASAERFNWRYFIYLVPPLLTLIVAVVVRAALDAASWFEDRRGDPDSGHRRIARLTAIGLAAVVAGALVLPDSLRAGQWEQDDWRGAAQEMVDLIDSNPQASFAILEPSFRAIPMFDYYLARYDEDVRVFAPLRILEERRGSDFVFERRSEELQDYDYVIVPFTHHRTTHFRTALERLEDRYDVAYWRTDEDNKGIVVFAVHGQGMIDG